MLTFPDTVTRYEIKPSALLYHLFPDFSIFFTKKSEKRCLREQFPALSGKFIDVYGKFFAHERRFFNFAIDI